MCKAVITESAQAYVENQTRLGIQQAKAQFQNPEQLKKLEKYHGEKTKWVLNAWTEVWLSDEFSSWSLKDNLPQVQCPVLIIHGDKDEYGTINFPKMISDLTRGPSQVEIIPGGGHVPHRESCNLILDLVHNFLEKMKI